MRCRALLVAIVLAGCDSWSGGGSESVGSATRAEPAIVGPAALRAGIAAGVRRIGANEASFEVDAFVAALAVEELAGGTGGIRVEAAVENGAQIGYRVAEVTPGSVYALVGLRAGDVIEAIGEVKLDGPGRAAGLVGSVGRGASIAVVRDGVGFSLEVRVAGGVAWAEMLRARTGVPGQVVADSSLGAGVNGQVAQDGNLGAGVAAPDGAEPVGALKDPFAGGSGTPAPSVGGGGGSSGTSGTGLKNPFKKSGSGGSSGSEDLKDPFAKKPAGASCVTAASCTIERATFQTAVADPGKLDRQVSIAPARGGYKLTRVSPGSTVAALGFRAGDVIISVNGARLDDDMAALGLYMGLESTRNFSVVYERNGVRATKAIAVK